MTAPRSIGLISDTHGLLRAGAVDALRGCEAIIHAGDVGSPGILQALAALAPLVAVRGNIDTGALAAILPETATLHVDAIAIHVLHDVAALALDPAAAGIRVVVSGHSHRPETREQEGVLFVNPGSAGRRRFSLPVMLGRLLVDGASVAAELIELET
nr:metallophosphoesterase family protein [uncultured Lichenicoccus sp.]